MIGDTGGGYVGGVSSDGHGLVPGVDEGNFLLESSLDGVVYFVSDSLVLPEVGVINMSNSLLIPLLHNILDHIVGGDDAMGGRRDIEFFTC